MTTAARQKQHERFLLERFLATAGMKADIVEEREAPDFIIHHLAAQIGVEITELFVPSNRCIGPPQAQEAISAKIVASAQRLYQAAGGRPAHVTVCFSPSSDLRRLRRDDVAAKLSAFVRNLDLKECQRFRWRPEELDVPLPDEISFISALGVPHFDVAHWGVARAGWAAALTTEALQSRVNHKAARLVMYRDAVAINWLVIVADGTKPSGMLDVDVGLKADGVVSPFNRTFFYSYPRPFVIELGVPQE